MKLTILGSSGSVGAPDNPSSGYLIQFENSPSIAMDFGHGVMGELQRIQDPNDAHVVFSHMHADHCMDFPALMVWRRFHPTQPAPGRNLCGGPKDAPVVLGRLSSNSIDKVDDMSDTFAFIPWESGKEEIFGAVTITPWPTIHPIDSYALRLKETRTGKVIAYSGDAAYAENLIDCARDADLFLCEATWGATSEGKAPDMHMSGAEAGRLARLAGAKKLVLVHIPPWSDTNEALAAARAEFDGEVLFGEHGLELTV